MEKIRFKTNTEQILADTITPVSIYLKIRDIYPKSILLESSDYRGNENSYSFICFQPLASFTVDDFIINTTYPHGKQYSVKVKDNKTVSAELNNFIHNFDVPVLNENGTFNGLFGYTAYDSVQYFETIKLNASKTEDHNIPDIYYGLYKYIIAVNHFQNNLIIIENLLEGEDSNIKLIKHLLNHLNIGMNKFQLEGHETSNLTDEEYMYMVKKGKDHCFRGDVFQIVMSRQYKQPYSGDDFNVYRALRSVNPSPYLFYFDFGGYRIFGSSPEAQIKIKEQKAYINPIAGTIKRTGDDEQDARLAEKLSNDPKENAEHVMLVDLARNDLSRNARNVQVSNYREIQFYSHVIHMVSTVCGELDEKVNIIDIMADTFPAGTLSGAPKYKAMELIDKYENQNRGYYGGAIGIIDFNGSVNHAIMIRSFLSKNNNLFYQAGAGIVSESKEKNELIEVNNKLGALKKALIMAEQI